MEPTEQQLKNRTNPPKEDPVINQIQSKLLQQSDLVSSSASNIEAKIGEAISGIQKGQEAGAARIESQFGREKAFQAEQFAQQKTSARESQRGFAVNTAAMRQLDERTEKSLRDLEQRKQELILAGESTAASQIAGLQVQSLQFQMQAQQQAFSNMLGIGQFQAGLKQLQIETQREARLQTAQELDATLAQAKFEFDKVTTLENQRQSQQRINIMQAELKLKQLEETGTAQPDPGFSSVDVQNSVGIGANALLETVSARKESGLITTQEEEEAATIDAYMQARRRFSTDQASDDALAKMFGLVFDDDGELGFITGPVSNEDVSLPGESKTFFNIFGEAIKYSFGDLSSLKKIQ